MDKIDQLKSVVTEFHRQNHQAKARDTTALVNLLHNSVIPRLNEALQDKLSEIYSYHNLEVDENEVIHYTSLGALMSMLREKEETGEAFLRMYDSFHLNDPEEGRYLINQIKPKSLSRLFPENRRPHAYIASFITPRNGRQDEDSLKYWRAYGQQGRGCSIKFGVGSDWGLRKILYGQEEVVKTLKKLDLKSIKECIGPIIKGNEKTHRVTKDVIYRAAMESLAQIMYLYKDGGFDYEQECRVVKSSIDIPNVEARKNGQAHTHKDVRFELLEGAQQYCSLRHYHHDRNLMIGNILKSGSTITIGPLVSNKHSVKEFVIDQLLKRAGIRGVTVEVSKISYQGPLR